MVYVSPDIGNGRVKTYEHAYKSILASRRRAPSTSAASVILLVSPEVDALCSARILSTLFKQDDVGHRIIPVSGYQSLGAIRDELMVNQELHTLILLNIGSLLDLPSSDWFGEFDSRVTIHVIDSTRPQNLSSLFGATPEAQRIVVWDDGGAADMVEVREAFETMEIYPDSDGSSSDSGSDSGDDSFSELDGDDIPSSKEKNRTSDAESGDESYHGPRRRRKLDDGTRRAGLSRVQREEYRSRLDRHYSSGVWCGQSASGIMYGLSAMLDRADNDLLCVKSHHRELEELSNSLRSKDQDEVARLNPSILRPNTSHPDYQAIRPSEEFRFSLFRHWNLYDAMYHSSYVANKLGIWQDRGRNRLQGLLAKMGYSLQQAQQTYQHMDMDLKYSLGERLESIAPEYGLIELYYPSFLRSYGFRSQPLSASDVVESVSALLQAAGGVRIEVESEGGHGGGEWFGGTRIWDIGLRLEDSSLNDAENVDQANRMTTGDGENGGRSHSDQWWIKNFWSAFDALNKDLRLMQTAVPLSKALHRAIVRQGSSLIDKRAIRTYRSFKLATVKEGPDLQTFSQPGTLSRLGLWLSEVLRDRQATVNSRGKRKSLPVLVACLNESEESFLVVGVALTTEEGDVRKNRFGVAFLEAKERSNARTRQGGTFDTSVIEVKKEDFTTFLEELQLAC